MRRVVFKYPSLKIEGNDLYILDQKELPQRIVYKKIKGIDDACEAIVSLRVRGAPLIGIFALHFLKTRINKSKEEIFEMIERLKNTRPTAYNLFNYLERFSLKLNLEGKREAEFFIERTIAEEENNSFLMAENGLKLLKENSTILTQCNTGYLAAPYAGTALSIIHHAHINGYKIRVYVPEVRPLMQGARLTAFELVSQGIEHTVIVDSAISTVMEEVDYILVGADRIAKNGDSANKIGTRNMAIIARYFNKPFYVVAPTSTIDRSLKHGADIKIEVRGREELAYCGEKKVIPDKSNVLNPAFDVTPFKLITGIITEKGVFYNNGSDFSF